MSLSVQRFLAVAQIENLDHVTMRTDNFDISLLIKNMCETACFRVALTFPNSYHFLSLCVTFEQIQFVQ